MKILAASAMAVLVVTSAHAMDSADNVTPYSWTGSYVGINTGGSWSNDSPSGTTYHLRGDDGTFENGWFGAERKSNGSSFIGGIQTGYNYQINNFVFGLEADLGLANTVNGYSATSDESEYVDPNYEYHLTEDLHSITKVEWFGTIRPRIGFLPQDRLMVYATGGLAYGKVKSGGGYNYHEYGYWWGGPDGDDPFDRRGGFNGSSSKIRLGWTVGGGAEYALTDHLSLKAEYLFVDLGEKSHISYSEEEEGEYAVWKDNAKFSMIKLGLNYKF